MKGLGNIKAKGKLTYLPSCKCCVFYNRKKYFLSNESIDINLLRSGVSNELNGISEYPNLLRLFGNKLFISLDHPVGEDVLFLDGKFIGYASSWVEMLDFAEKSDIKYSSHEELENIFHKETFNVYHL